MYGLLIEGAIQFVKEKFGDEILEKVLKLAKFDKHS
jgi:hypothetical protein